MSIKKLIEVIVFDLGGVIVNVNFKSPLGVLFDNSGAPGNTIRNDSNISKLTRQYDKGEISAEDFHQKIIKHLGIELSFDEFRRASNEAIEPGDSGMDNLVKTLSTKYQLAILSNTNPVHFEHIKENYPIIGLFEHISVSYEMGAIKPDVEAYEKLMLATSKLPSQHLFIDDRIENISAAREIGMDGIHYESIKGLLEALRERGINV